MVMELRFQPERTIPVVEVMLQKRVLIRDVVRMAGPELLFLGIRFKIYNFIKPFKDKIKQPN
jgi:hypothetical protein